MAKKSKAAKGLATNEEITKEFKGESNAYFERFKTQRVDVDELRKLADYMYAAAQNRTIMASEGLKGMALNKDPRANVGSVIFHRQVNQLATTLVQIVRSRPDLFKYRNYVNPLVPQSGKESLDRSTQANMLARWTRKEDSFDERFPEFAVHAFKYSTVFAMVEQKRTFKRVAVTVPKLEQTGADENGVPIMRIVGEVTKYEEKLNDNFPSIRFPHVDMVFADRYVPTIKGQNCVILLSLRNRSEIYSDVQSKFFDEKQYELLGEKELWDGNYGATVKKQEADNREGTWSPSGGNQMLQWDIFMRSPIDGTTWDDEKNPPVLYWASIVGNTISDGIVMRLERNPDPDDEIPLKEINVMMDKSDTLYHTTTAEIVRSAYSADCTLLNLALDNMAVVNDPPLMVVDGEHRISDFTFKRGQRWHVNNVNNVLKQFEVRDVTLQTVNLRSQVREEIMMALATDPAFMGQYAGARTSASEFIGVNSNSKGPHMVQAGYILQQLLPWMAKKYMSYWEAFGKPNQVIQITDQDKAYKINPKEIAGEYDIEVSLVDEYEDDIVKEQKLYQLIQVIASVPAFQQSPSHTLNMGNLLKELFEKMKYNPSDFIDPPQGIDAEVVANMENHAMLELGKSVQPVQGENTQIHLAKHTAEELRWKGLEDSNDPRARNLPLLQQHIAQTKQMAQAGAGPKRNNLPAESGNQTAGQVVGNEAAGVLGSMMGGPPSAPSAQAPAAPEGGAA